MSNELLTLFVYSVLLGVGATIVMDMWALILQRFMGITPLNYALVGRWLVYICKGTFYHVNIATTKPVAAELVVGWTAHYLIGVVFSATLIMFMGNDWVSECNSRISFWYVNRWFSFFYHAAWHGFWDSCIKNP